MACMEVGHPTIGAYMRMADSEFPSAWTKRALNAGKHVLLEKPFTANAEEAREVVELARQKNLVLVEAFHWQFHV